jgi:hypothetical protein
MAAQAARGCHDAREISGGSILTRSRFYNRILRGGVPLIRARSSAG